MLEVYTERQNVQPIEESKHEDVVVAPVVPRSTGSIYDRFNMTRLTSHQSNSVEGAALEAQL